MSQNIPLENQVANFLQSWLGDSRISDAQTIVTVT